MAAQVMVTLPTPEAVTEIPTDHPEAVVIVITRPETVGTDLEGAVTGTATQVVAATTADVTRSASTEAVEKTEREETIETVTDHETMLLVEVLKLQENLTDARSAIKSACYIPKNVTKTHSQKKKKEERGENYARDNVIRARNGVPSQTLYDVP